MSFKKCRISLDLSGSENNKINIEGIPDYKMQDIKIQSVTLGEWLSDRLIQGDRLIQVARNTGQRIRSPVLIRSDVWPQIETFISGVLMICENIQGNQWIVVPRVLQYLKRSWLDGIPQKEVIEEDYKLEMLRRSSARETGWRISRSIYVVELSEFRIKNFDRQGKCIWDLKLRCSLKTRNLSIIRA